MPITEDLTSISTDADGRLYFVDKQAALFALSDSLGRPTADVFRAAIASDRAEKAMVDDAWARHGAQTQPRTLAHQDGGASMYSTPAQLRDFERRGAVGSSGGQVAPQFRGRFTFGRGKR